MPTVLGQKTKWNVYHYTDLNALINILASDKILLRATNISYLNDPHELIEGISTINEVQKKHIEPGGFRNYYITSFSSCQDNLNMWGMYAANGNGCALAFDYDELSKGYEILIKCTYGKDEAKQSFNNFYNLTQTGVFTSFLGAKLSKEDEEANRNALAANSILTTCLGAKNEAYRYESETRGIVYCDNPKLIHFRRRNNYIIPYIEVSLPKNALREIVIGPTDNTYLKELSIYQFLQIKGYNLDNVKIVKSNIPYRG